MQQSKEKYVMVLAEEISENYYMTYEEAISLVRSSFVPKMLIDDEDAIYMMHEPIGATASEIVCEYLEREFPANIKSSQMILLVSALFKEGASVNWICEHIKNVERYVVEIIYLLFIRMDKDGGLNENRIY